MSDDADSPFSAAFRAEETPALRGYRVEEILGSGGHSTVYLATAEEVGADAAPGTRVAIKHWRDAASEPAARARLEREVEVLRGLDHPHLVRFLGLTEDAQGAPAIVMEAVEGPNLAELISREGPLAVERVQAIGAALCLALEHLAAQGLVHRDVKPANVIIRADDQPVLVDFSVTKRVEAGGSDEAAQLTGTGAALGTSAYMAPEQCAGDLGPIDARTDVYGVGALLFQALTGLPPWTHESGWERTQRNPWRQPYPAQPAERARVEAARDRAPEGLGAVVARCLEGDPRARFPEAAALRAALLDPPVASRGPRWRAGALALALCCAVSYGFFNQASWLSPNHGQTPKEEPMKTASIAALATMTPLLALAGDSPLPADRVDSTREGQVVRVRGRLQPARLEDPAFKVAAQGLRLERVVERFQWTETKSVVGNRRKKRIVYQYDLAWRPGREDSNRFRQPKGHENPDSLLPVEGRHWEASPLRLGAYRVEPVLVEDELSPQDLRLDAAQPQRVSGLDWTPRGDAFYPSSAGAEPKLGDVRVRFLLSSAPELTVGGVLHGRSLLSAESARAKTEGIGAKLAQALAQDDEALFASTLRPKKPGARAKAIRRFHALRKRLQEAGFVPSELSFEAALVHRTGGDPARSPEGSVSNLLIQLGHGKRRLWLLLDDCVRQDGRWWLTDKAGTRWIEAPQPRREGEGLIDQESALGLQGDLEVRQDAAVHASSTIGNSVQITPEDVGIWPSQVPHSSPGDASSSTTVFTFRKHEARGCGQFVTRYVSAAAADYAFASLVRRAREARTRETKQDWTLAYVARAKNVVAFVLEEDAGRKAPTRSAWLRTWIRTQLAKRAGGADRVVTYDPASETSIATLFQAAILVDDFSALDAMLRPQSKETLARAHQSLRALRHRLRQLGDLSEVRVERILDQELTPLAESKLVASDLQVELRLGQASFWVTLDDCVRRGNRWWLTDDIEEGRLKVSPR